MEGDVRLATGIPARLSGAEGRRFGLTVGGAFLLLAALAWWRGRPLGLAVFATLGALLVLSGFAVPTRLSPIFRAWMALAQGLSRITTPLFLGVIFFLVLTPSLDLSTNGATLVWLACGIGLNLVVVMEPGHRARFPAFFARDGRDIVALPRE